MGVPYFANLLHAVYLLQKKVVAFWLKVCWLNSQILAAEEKRVRNCRERVL
jgi:hypothetical protein